MYLAPDLVTFGFDRGQAETTAGVADGISSAGHVQDGVRFAAVVLERFDRFGSREHKQFDLAALGFALNFSHDWQRAGSRADDEALAFPRDLLLGGQRRVSGGVAELSWGGSGGPFAIEPGTGKGSDDNSSILPARIVRLFFLLVYELRLPF